MSSTIKGLTEDRQDRLGQAPLGLQYAPTAEELRVFRECYEESLWYRSLPFSSVSMLITYGLITRGTLAASPRFGSVPKLFLAGLFGHIAGQLSYAKVCQEKFKTLENSPLGDAVRQRTGLPPQSSKGVQSEPSDQESKSFESMFRPAEAASQMSYNTESPMQMSRSDDFSAPVESYEEEEEPQRKAILYEDLRLKNRENYGVTLTQKAETLLEQSPKKESKGPQKAKNIYGDIWEE